MLGAEGVGAWLGCPSLLAYFGFDGSKNLLAKGWPASAAHVMGPYVATALSLVVAPVFPAADNLV